MYANSREVNSVQTGPHEKLAEFVQRHRTHVFRKPYAPWNVEAFETAMRSWSHQAPLLLDSACGVGWSSLQLARQYPDHFVIGVDQSEDRLERGKPGEMPENLIFVRADLVDFWRLLVDARVRLARHYILYPNPWPKIGHLARRWHGHPVFPAIPALGGVLECRSNWRTYVEELAQALQLSCGRAGEVEEFLVSGEPLTAFERKYRDSGQALYRLIVDLGEA